MHGAGGGRPRAGPAGSPHGGSGWTQPLFEPVGTGVTAFLTQEFDGVPHVLVHARVEG